MNYPILNTYQQEKSYSRIIIGADAINKVKISFYREPQRRGAFTVAGNLFVNEKFISGLFTTGQENLFYADSKDLQVFNSTFTPRSSKVYFAVTLENNEIKIGER